MKSAAAKIKTVNAVRCAGCGVDAVIAMREGAQQGEMMRWAETGRGVYARRKHHHNRAKSELNVLLTNIANKMQVQLLLTVMRVVQLVAQQRA